jgi:hypothetical protein
MSKQEFDVEYLVAWLQGLGFPEDDCRKALKSAKLRPHLAAEYLINGNIPIPDEECVPDFSLLDEIRNAGPSDEFLKWKTERDDEIGRAIFEIDNVLKTLSRREKDEVIDLAVLCDDNTFALEAYVYSYKDFFNAFRLLLKMAEWPDDETRLRIRHWRDRMIERHGFQFSKDLKNL